MNQKLHFPNLEDRSLRPLECDEVEQLRSRFENVRYIAYAPQLDTLLSQEFLRTIREEELLFQDDAIATVILPR